MKTFKRYLVPALLGISIGMIALDELKAAACMLAVTGFFIWIAILQDWIRNKTVLSLVAGGLVCLMAAPNASAWYPKPPPSKDAATQIVAGIAVIVVGAFVYVGLRSLCKRLLTPKKAEAQPDNPPGTNSVAIVGPIQQCLPFDDAAITATDISDYATNSAFTSPDGSKYAVTYEMRFRFSTDLSNWTTNKITGWLSQQTHLVSCAGQTVSCPIYQTPLIDLGLPKSDKVFVQMLP